MKIIKTLKFIVNKFEKRERPSFLHEKQGLQSGDRKGEPGDDAVWGLRPTDPGQVLTKCAG